MYAAAGGASIASRKARQNKALVKGGAKKTPAKGAKAHLKTEKPQSKQFHHLPENYHKRVESSGGLAPPTPSLHHSRSLTLRGDDNDPSGLRHSRSAHELPSEAQHTGPYGSPPRAYTCPHWEAKLSTAPPERIVAFGSTDVPYAVCECAQGKAAWQEAAVGAAGIARRCSVAADGGPGAHRSKQNEARLRWIKKNKIRDFSYGGSSSDEEEGSRSGSGNAAGSLLYVGLGTVALGLVISFVGTGEKGFKTPELRWTGPALICAGLFFCILRIVLCACPRRCGSRPRSRPKEPAAERLLLAERPPPAPRKLSATTTALLLRREREAPPQLPPAAPPPPHPPPPAPAPTPAPTAVPQLVPLVLLSQPEKVADSLAEFKAVDCSSFDISSISSSEMSVDNLTVIENADAEGDKTNKLHRNREPAHAKRIPGSSIPRTVTFADTPNIITPPSEAPPPAVEIVLTPSSLGQRDFRRDGAAE